MDSSQCRRVVGRTLALGATLATGVALVGIPSAWSAALSAPGAPSNVHATAQAGAIALTWTAPGSNGGKPITSYKATCKGTAGGLTKTATSATTTATVSGVTAGKSYTCTVTATNADGTSPASAPSNAVVPIGKPTAPLGVSTLASSGNLTVKWQAPSSTGGATITKYTVACKSTDGGHAVNGTTTGARTLVLSGATNNKTYSCTVSASNSIGTGPVAKSNYAMWAAVTNAGGSQTMHVPATAGFRGSVLTSSISTSTCSTNTTLKAPSGTTLHSQSSCGGSIFIDSTALTANGTYQVITTAPTGATVSDSLQMWVFKDIAGKMKANGPLVTAAVYVPGQAARYAVSLSPGPQVTMRTTSVTTGSCVPVSLLAPNGSQVEGYCVGANGFVDAQTLTVSGTYTVVVDPQSADSGSVAVGLNTFTDVHGTAHINGATISAKFTHAGQRAYYTFQGAANQHVTVKALTSFPSCVGAGILDPNGHSIGGTCISPGWSLGLTLPTAGTYTLVIDPQGTDIGTEKVNLVSP